MHIGICDDDKSVIELVHSLCEKYFAEGVEEHSYIKFTSGEDVLKYLQNKDNVRIDLLFLDIEMNGISGIELKNLVIKQDMVWRIAFVSNHLESTFDAYGTKTIGFIPKPPSYENIKKMLNITMEEFKENVTIAIKGYNGEVIEVKWDDVIYLKADGSYTEIYTYKSILNNEKYILCTKKLGVLENDLKNLSIIRVHKSYLVNIENVLDIGKYVVLRGITENIPVGRSYKDTAKRKFYAYGKNRIRKRL